MIENVENAETDQPDSTATKSEPKKEIKNSLGEYVEGVLADILSTFTRFFITLYLFVFRPQRVVTELTQESPSYQYLVRPHTFLLLSCMLYSIYLTSLDLASRHRETNEAITASLQQLLSNGVSLVALILTTLPILFVTSLFSVIAGRLLNSNYNLKIFFIYLYGLQCSLILLFMLTAETQSEIFQYFLKGDDYIIIVIILLLLLIGIQSWRCFNKINISEDSNTFFRRSLHHFFFFILFVIPIPLSGYVVNFMQSSVEKIKNKDKLSRPEPTIRIINVTKPNFSSALSTIELIAIVENRSDKMLVIKPNDVQIDINFISQSELNRSSSFGRLLSNVKYDLDSYDRYITKFDKARVEPNSTDYGLWTMAPNSSDIIKISASQKINNFNFRGHDRDRYKFRDKNIKEYWKHASKREKPIYKELRAIPDQKKLTFVAADRRVFIKVGIIDSTLKKRLNSYFFQLPKYTE